MVIESGMLIRDYRIVSLLGSGGMGDVWLAEDVNIQRKLAIKVLNPSLAADAGLAERFRLEAQMQAELHHPGIVNIHSFFAHEDSYLLCMEYARGITLRDLIGITGPIPYERAVMIILQVLRTLQFIHERGIIHRDIKPSNIMIDTEHNDNVKVMDFGIAKAMGSIFKTRTGTTMGSPLYMSPEQITRGSNLDLRTDIFSLGVTFFEMLSGRLPYNTDTESEYNIQKQIVEMPMPDPRSYYPHIPGWVIPILSRMSEKDEARRWQNCTTIIDALEAGLRGRPSQIPAQAPPLLVNNPQPVVPPASGYSNQDVGMSPNVRYLNPPKQNNLGLWIGLGIGAFMFMMIAGLLIIGIVAASEESPSEEPAPLEEPAPMVPPALIDTTTTYEMPPWIIDPELGI